MSVVTASILSDAAKIDAIYELISIDVRRQINRIPHATLVLLDGDAARRKFDLSDAKYFEPGKEIEVKLRYESETEDATIFKGPVVRHGIEASVQGSLLRVELKDAAVKLTRGRKSMVYVDTDDATLIGKLISDGGLKSGIIDPTTPKHAQIVQYYCTDWDFLVARAESQGLLTVAEDGVVSARKPELSGEAKHSFEYGVDEIYDFEFELDASDQYEKVQSTGWDIKECKLTAAAEAKAFALSQGNVDGAKLAKTVGFVPVQLSHTVAITPEELQSWADGRLMRSRMSLLRGRVSAEGLADVKLLDVMAVDGVGERFNGKTLVTGICHRVDVDGWRTDIQFGMSAREFAFENEIEDAPSAGLLPAISGLHVGVVDKFEEDPDKQFRVKVILPGIDEKSGSVWARLAAPDAGKGRGWFLRPETGDEVVVGFFSNDPRQPVILGAMFGPKNSPPDDYSALSADNKNKVIVTKTGSVIGFLDDQKGSIFIKTKEGAQIQLDDTAKSLSMVDQNGNELTMDQNGIALKSAKDFKVEASGNVEIKGAKVDVK